MTRTAISILRQLAADCSSYSVRNSVVNEFIRRGRPCVLQGAYARLPALSRWTLPAQEEGVVERTLNAAYFLERIKAHGEDPFVDVERGRYKLGAVSGGGDSVNDEFMRTRVPLSLFVRLVSTPDVPREYATMYLAQTPLLDALPALREDVIMASSDKGGYYMPQQEDVYACSAWIGRETYTPRHFDPNDNLYVMVAGRKRVALWAPPVQAGAAAGRRRSGAFGNENFEEAEEGEATFAGEIVLAAGDGLYIPARWWHEVESVGTGTTASVNWWFRESHVKDEQE
ncbi:uncharacterized protein V1518DRAFT_409546 [Limtongia smithiae]|uniref:uncharacterized protein n=1 Tax=Limtongia smithiae TaxID=1125753 RepID=UPI0034CF83DA